MILTVTYCNPCYHLNIFKRFLAQPQAHAGNNSYVSVNGARFNTVKHIDDKMSPMFLALQHNG
jgi:hypothetical protein